MKLTRLKHVAQINRSQLPEGTDPAFTFKYVDISAVSSTGRITLPEASVAFADAPSRARRTAPAGAVLVSTVRTYLRAITRVPRTDEPLVFSTGFAVLEAYPAMEPRFLYYLCSSSVVVDEVVARSTGVSYPAIDASDLGDIPVAVPDRDAQRRIADFLEDQVARLDRAITLQQTQVELTQERATTFVSELLAMPERGGNGQPGLAWLAASVGPLTKLGAVSDLQSGITVDGARTGGVEYPYVRVANVQNGRLALDEVKTIFVPIDVARGSMLRDGDVLMTEGGDLDKLGRGTVWHGEIENCLHQNHVFALRPHAQVLLPEYLAHLTRTHHARSYFESTGSRSTNLASTNSTKILAFRFPLPSLAVQEVKLQELRDADDLADRVMALARRKISLLQERKQALITAAVTGQFDVTTARTVAA